MLSGAFSGRDWRNLASLDLYNPNIHASDKANACLRKAMTSIYDYSCATWKHCNDLLLHTKDSDALAISIRSVLPAVIKHYHSRPHTLCFDDRHLCERSLTKLLDGSEATQRRWLRMVKKSVGAVKHQGTSQAVITSFFAQRLYQREGEWQ